MWEIFLFPHLPHRSLKVMEPGGNYEHFVWIYSPPFCQIPHSHTYYLHSTDTGRWRVEGILCDTECHTSHYFSSPLTITARPVCWQTTLIRLHWTEKTFYQIFASRLIIYRPNRSRGHTKVLLKEWRMWGTTLISEWQDSRPLNRSSISGGEDRRRSWRVVTSRDTAWRVLQGVTQPLYLYSLLPPSPLLA